MCVIRVRARARVCGWRENLSMYAGEWTYASVCIVVYRGYHVDASGKNRLQLVARCAVQIIEIVTSAERLAVSIAALRSEDHLCCIKIPLCRPLDCILLRRFASIAICQINCIDSWDRDVDLWIVAAIFLSYLTYSHANYSLIFLSQRWKTYYFLHWFYIHLLNTL